MDTNHEIDLLRNPALNPANWIVDEICEPLVHKLKQLTQQQSPDISL